MDVVLVGRDVLKTLGIDPLTELEELRAAGYLKEMTFPCPREKNDRTRSTMNCRMLKSYQRSRWTRLSLNLSLVGRIHWNPKKRRDLEIHYIVQTYLENLLLQRWTGPAKVHLVPGAIPRKAKMRRYAPKNAKFMHDSLRLLQKLGYVRFHPRSSPVLIVHKPMKLDEFRTSLGTRYFISQMIPVVSPMTILEVILQRFSEARTYACLDTFKGFWEFPLHVNRHGMYSRISDLEICTPTRLIQRQLSPQMLSKQRCWKHFEISSILAC
jgi:hypothetical protein